MKDPRIRFDTRTTFARELERRAGACLEAAGQKPRDARRMYLKSLVLGVWWVASVALFVAGGFGLLGTVLLAISAGLATAGVGMSVQHDGGHRAYSDRPWLNKLTGRTLDLLGASSYVWNHKHNVMHHTYPNVAGSDDDLDVGPLARLAPGSKWRLLHRWQHLYMWPLYAFATLKWHLFDDFYQVARGRISGHAFPRPRGRDLVWFWTGKLAFFAWAVALPVLFQPLALAAAFYFVMHGVQGFVLGATFQLAHCVQEASYFTPAPDGRPVEVDFAKHQLAATVDFATGNRLATWYMGGLNFQAVHHVFPRVCHVHYPALSKVVAEVCAEHGVTYRPAPTLRAALRSHYRQLRALGAPPAASAPVVEPPPVAAPIASRPADALS